MDLFRHEIRRRFPDLPPDRVEALARVWVSHRDKIIDRVSEITRDSGRVAWHINGREEAIGRMARMLIFLTDKIIEHRTNERSIDSIEPREEQSLLQEHHALARIENTAQALAQVWCGVYDELSRSHPLVIAPSELEGQPLLPGGGRRQRQPATTRNHFVPRFSTKPWADSQGRVRVFRRRSNGVMTTRVRSYRSFGHERFLYPHRLEEWFSQVEQQAQVPYGKLVSPDALTQGDRYSWIAFLAVQHLRTPSYMAEIAHLLRRRAKDEEWPWAMTPSLLRNAHTLLFENDELFTAYYRRFNGRRWEVWRAAEGHAFPRTDCPILATVSNDGRGWRCYYPLTPTKCFVAGPDEARDNDVPAALTRHLSLDETTKLVESLIATSRRSFVTRILDPEVDWLRMAQRVPVSDPLSGYRAWGELDGE